MVDMLVKLYELIDDWSFLAVQEDAGITIRKPIGPEKRLIVDWVRDQFWDAWASETDIAISNAPRTCFVAIKDGQIIGFSCYDATALGYFGPIGVDPPDSAVGVRCGIQGIIGKQLDFRAVALPATVDGRGRDTTRK